MPVDSRDPAFNLRIPNVANTVAEDIERIRLSLIDVGAALASLTSSVSGKAALSHLHDMGDVTGLLAALAGKSDTSHTHTLDALSDVSAGGATSGQALIFASGNWGPGGISVTQVDGVSAVGLALATAPNEASVRSTLTLGRVGVWGHHSGRTPPPGALVRNGANVSRTTYADLFAVLCPDMGTVTISIGSPGVITRNGHGLENGARVRFSTTGALPTGIAANTDYFVVGSATNTFNVAATVGGAAINTTGTQSGVHSMRTSMFGFGDGSTTFTLPDGRGEFDRGWDAGRGADAGRVLGSSQSHMFQDHSHSTNATTNLNIPGGGAIDVFRAGSQTGTVNGANSGNFGSETRPRNIAGLPIIWFV